MNQKKERNPQEEAQVLSLSQAHQELLTDHCDFPHQSSQQTQDASTLRFFFPPPSPSLPNHHILF